ncbi:MAG: phosphatidate cytidylyltransferase [Candidatus Heimdallarchaeota archaeon]|nr:phosphatidate cytidylyltransferase [Candidatus Heimdallarchaeota archaeon]
MSKTTEFNFLNELVRKAVHLSVLIIPFAFHVLQIELWFIQLSLFGVLCFFIPMEIYRLKINPSTWLNFITRESEKEYPANYILTTLIWLIVLLGVGYFYSIIIAELALVATVLGDSAAALIGRGIGKHRLPNTQGKTIEGYIGGLVFTFTFGFIFLFIIGVQGYELFIVPILPAIAVAIFDFFEDLPFWAADNLFHPLITLILGYILTLLNIISIEF